jgi:hypothetical protein
MHRVFAEQLIGIRLVKTFIMVMDLEGSIVNIPGKKAKKFAYIKCAYKHLIIT